MCRVGMALLRTGVKVAALIALQLQNFSKTKVNSYNPGRDSGFVVGAFGEVSMKVCDLADLVACELNAKHLALFDGAMNESKQIFTKRICRSNGLAVHRGWAKLLLDRCHGLVQDPRHSGICTEGVRRASDKERWQFLV